MTTGDEQALFNEIKTALRDAGEPCGCILACPTHKAAPTLLAALDTVLPMAAAYLKSAPSHPDNAKLEDARAAIRQAREVTT